MNQTQTRSCHLGAQRLAGKKRLIEVLTRRVETGASQERASAAFPARPATGYRGGDVVSGGDTGEGGQVETSEVGPEHMHREGKGGHKGTTAKVMAGTKTSELRVQKEGSWAIKMTGKTEIFLSPSNKMHYLCR